MSDEAVDLISKMLKFDKDKRITAIQCLQHPFFDSVPENLKQ
jgi:serine/threonine protein kinase